MFRLDAFDRRSFHPISWAPADEWHVDPLELHQAFVVAMLEAAAVRQPAPPRRVFKGKAKAAPASLLDVDPGELLPVALPGANAAGTASQRAARQRQEDDDLALTLILLEACT